MLAWGCTPCFHCRAAAAAAAAVVGRPLAAAAAAPGAIPDSIDATSESLSTPLWSCSYPSPACRCTSTSQNSSKSKRECCRPGGQGFPQLASRSSCMEFVGLCLWLLPCLTTCKPVSQHRLPAQQTNAPSLAVCMVPNMLHAGPWFCGARNRYSLARTLQPCNSTAATLACATWPPQSLFSSELPVVFWRCVCMPTTLAIQC